MLPTLDSLATSSTLLAGLESPAPSPHPWSLPFRVVVINPLKLDKKPSTYAYCATADEAELIAVQQNELAEQRAADATVLKTSARGEQAQAWMENFPQTTPEELVDLFPPPEPVQPFKYIAIDATGLWGQP